MRVSDLVALGELIADGLRFTGPDGTVFGRQADLEAHRTGATRFDQIDEVSRSTLESGDTGKTETTAEAVLVNGSARILKRLLWRRSWKIIGGRWQVIEGSVIPLDP
jgi:hypothetical protein